MMSNLYNICLNKTKLVYIELNIGNSKQIFLCNFILKMNLVYNLLYRMKNQ